MFPNILETSTFKSAFEFQVPDFNFVTFHIQQLKVKIFKLKKYQLQMIFIPTLISNWNRSNFKEFQFELSKSYNIFI